MSIDKKAMALAIATIFTFGAEAAKAPKSPTKAPSKPPTRLVLQIDRVHSIQPTKGWREGRNEIEMSAIVIRPPNSVKRLKIWKVGSFGKGDGKNTKYQLASFDLPTKFKSPQTYGVLLMMADRDDGGFGSYLDKVANNMQAAVNGVVQSDKKKGGPKAEDVIELAADYLGQGWAADLAKKFVKLLGRNSADEILTPPLVQKQTIGPDFQIDGKAKTVEFKGYGGHFKVTYTWRLI